MALITPQAAGGTNVVAFLDAIASCEGTCTSPSTQNDGYDVIVTGQDGHHEVFHTYGDHPFANGRPPKVLNSQGLASTASGRYQELYHYWPFYRQQLQLSDFSPMSQDLLAIHRLKEKHAYDDVVAGRIVQAVRKVNTVWASLPESPYGQHPRSMETFLTFYAHRGGTISNA